MKNNGLSNLFREVKRFLNIFDPTLRSLKENKEEKLAWIRDQYMHPIERLHTLDEVLKWFKENDINFINSIPSCDFDEGYEDLFEIRSKGSIYSRIINRLNKKKANFDQQ